MLTWRVPGCVLLLSLVAIGLAQNEGQTTHLYSVGEKGDRGEKGNVGSPGYTGEKGQQGATGTTGAVGVKGSKGDQGTAGENGINIIGATGSTGATGQQGELGIQGLPGLQGLPGEAGLPGDSGPKGNPGADGLKGNQGPAGSPGVQGTKGPRGAPGEDGEDGEMGFAGLQGDNGPKGERGPEGDSLQDVLDGRTTTCLTLQCVGATCEETLTGAICKCVDGYQFVPGDNTRCEDVNECTTGVCQYSCMNTDGGYTCKCPQGYTMQSNNITCMKEPSGCGACTSEEACVSLASGSQCLLSTISVIEAEDSVAVASQYNRQVDVPYTSDGLVNESWVIIFIVWGCVLSIITLILIIWLIHETRLTAEGKGGEEHHYESLNGTMQRNVYLTPVPSAGNSLQRYDSVNSPYRDLPYRPDYHGNGNGNIVIYN